MTDEQRALGRQLVASGTKWEEVVGYSRAIRVANQVYVSGTVATDSDGRPVGLNDPYAQTVFIINKIEQALHEVGASLKDVVRTRLFVINVKDWETVGRAHGEFFKEIKPATTLVEVAALIAPEYLIEIEVDAIIQSL